MNHIYCVVECRSCKRESKSNWLILKYMGPDDGRRADIIPLPLWTLRVNMSCKVCGDTNTYRRHEIEIIRLGQPPAPDSVGQL